MGNQDFVISLSCILECTLTTSLCPLLIAKSVGDPRYVLLMPPPPSRVACIKELSWNRAYLFQQVNSQGVIVDFDALQEPAYHSGNVVIQYGSDRMSCEFGVDRRVKIDDVATGQCSYDGREGLFISKLEVNSF